MLMMQFIQMDLAIKIRLAEVKERNFKVYTDFYITDLLMGI